MTYAKGYTIIKKAIVAYTVCFLVSNVLCYIDYETVSLVHAWSNETTRKEIFLLAVLLSLGYLLVAGVVKLLLLLYRFSLARLDKTGTHE